MEYIRLKTILKIGLGTKWINIDMIMNPETKVYVNKIEFYKCGKLHREDGPAIIGFDGTQAWYRDGVLCREDGPAIIFYNNEQQWFNKDGVLHREDGPAIITMSGIQQWYKNGKKHREDGPAVIYPNNNQQWWINGVRTDV